MSNNKYKVQVICLTYNHKDYIEQALRGFVMQKVDFLYEVLVGDDCSTDGTTEIIKKYSQKYPDIIKLIKRKKNLGSMLNGQDLRKRIKAEYICYCEGDDYWTDENKLQKQVDFLDTHPEYRGCFHDAEILKPKDKYWYADEAYEYDKEGKRYLPRSKKGFVKKHKYTVPDLIGNYIIHTATIMYRWNYNIEFPAWMNECRGGDIIIQMLQCGKGGYYYYMPEAMSVYRVANGVSAYKNHKDLVKISKIDTLLTYQKLKEYFSPNYEKEFSTFMQANFAQLFRYINQEEDVDLLEKFIKNFPNKYIKLTNYFMKQTADKNLRKSSNVWKISVLFIELVKVEKQYNCLTIYLFGIIPIIKYKRKNN